MRKSADLFKSFYWRVSCVDSTASKITALNHDSKLTKRDLAALYEGLFLQCVVSFELFIQDMFLGLVTKQIAYPRPVRLLVIFPNMPAAKRIIVKDKYINWLPYENLRKISEIYFNQGSNPFSNCPQNHTSEISKAHIIRNYIAHKSDFAWRKFENTVAAPTRLPAGQQNLLSYFHMTHSPEANKFQYHIGELVNAARWLSGLKSRS